MARVVRDGSGRAWELVAGSVARERGPSGRADVASITHEREHSDAMLAALVEIGQVAAHSEPLGFDVVRDLVERALRDGSLALQRADGPRPHGDIVDPGEPEPLVPDDDDDVVDESHTLEIELVDPAGKPVKGAAFKVRLPDGEIRKGNLDAKGQATIDDIKTAGDCEVTFTAFDQDAWTAA